MSNSVVGDIYMRIIQDVIDNSRIDFEEAGVSAGTLEDLKTVWQQKLSDLHVAHFPWEPAPPPTQPDPITKKPNANAPTPQIKKESPAVPYERPSTDNGGPKIKTEPGLEPQGISAPPLGNSHLDPQLAARRAQQNIQQKFGGGAVPLLAQQQKPNGVAKQPAGGLMLPGAVAASTHQANGQNGIPQVDGVDDIAIEGLGHLTRHQADQIILKRIKATEKKNAEFQQALQSLRGGSRKGEGKRKREDAYSATLSDRTSYPYPSSSCLAPSPCRLQQVDGPGSSDPEDDDAINSDLDDPEENEIDPEDDDESPQIMLCMYDKVQRTKNKWKCVLKDGVLTINGKEYVFHKATGEYEW